MNVNTVVFNNDFIFLLIVWYKITAVDSDSH
ncbi:hypothetical protein J2772_000203 [Chryseobacterium jejuense]|nr:hypothetical protein [Chryseobacterium jejuense]